MNYKIFFLIIFSFFLFSCQKAIINETKNETFEVKNRFNNTGFALVYNDKLNKIRPLNTRSLDIYHKSLKSRSKVKILNPTNGKYLIANVKSNTIKFSPFYNSVISPRIAKDLDLDLNEPFIEITSISKNSTFIAKKTKMFEEEKSVAEKAPVDGIQISDLNSKSIKNKKIVKKVFSYSIKVADFYHKDFAKIMLKRIQDETSIKNLKIIELSKTKFRLLIGPFNDIKSLKNSFEKMKIFNFENLEILKDV